MASGKGLNTFGTGGPCGLIGLSYICFLTGIAWVERRSSMLILDAGCDWLCSRTTAGTRDFGGGNLSRNGTGLTLGRSLA